MNKVILMGRLTRDAEMFGQKSKVARFTLAVDRSYGEDETDFFNCVSFGKQAEFVEKFLKKGIKVLVTGRLQNNSYEDKQGQVQKNYDVRVWKLLRGGKLLMIKEVDKFLKENFEISLETYFRLTNSKLKKLLKAEIKNFLEQ